MQNENDIDNPVTHLMNPFTGKAACREYSDKDYIEQCIPEFVTCKKCIDWYYQEYLSIRMTETISEIEKNMRKK